MTASVSFVVCDLAGNIIRVGSCPEFLMSAQAGEGEIVLAGHADSSLHYIDVDTGNRMDKERISPVVNGLAVSSLPIPCTVYSEGVAYDIDDGEVTMSFDVPGTYGVLICAERMIPAAIEVTQP